MTRGQILKMGDRALDKAVKIAGTAYDRRRKVDNNMLKKMNKMQAKGNSYSEIAEAVGVAPSTARYNLDEEYKAHVNSARKNYKRSKPLTSSIERARYKRELVQLKRKVIFAN